MKCIAVTGATGMLGLALMESALQDGEITKIYAIIREDTPKIERIPNDNRITVVTCNIDSYHTLKSKIKVPVDVFYHLAWKNTGKRRNEDIQGQAENVLYTLQAVRAAAELGCRKFVGAGSQAEYGDVSVSPIAPDTTANPIEPYGITKFCAGRLAGQEAARLKMDFFWVRIFSVYGKFDMESTMVTSTVNKLLRGESPSFTPAENIWDFLESRDAGRALWMIGKKASGNKIYCLGSGEGRPLRDYIKVIGESVNREAALGIGEIPYPAGRRRNICADIAELMEDTGWKPQISFAEGIADMIAYKRGEYDEEGKPVDSHV